ncbi:TonB-dependent siderophore receptor [Neorhizobium galegae]|uniref:TonB-dependent siderophore receptor n=1 Tax=Neorhizobium galegae TaxID=399 RepID=UPI000620F40F|nr:TonB-dependent siderophore receptor [Neorhizobium galegae]CDZ60436.1 Ferric hydroxamate outer membrane receptor FhuA [Neorhizobium galegae bv. orientalis]KAB1120883.1 TonB-dependent siderophore receptor [Neorhizobium galegae]MCQ1574431.1 TonB-dependent siderophore receptor [Neorhizobium galegae]MCQ1810396.1 TonB-dependent siderophore receptor [Neorhizobium galegae]CDZ71853.1 Ferric hydroxamate outer membrane receptor FhuA [Neorhizobium galegae bv. orientalis]
MDNERTSARSRQALIRYRNAVLLGCTALVAFTPTILLGQENATADTTLEPIVIQGSGAGLDTDNDSKSIIATKTTGVGKMPADILETPASVSVITSKEVRERGADSIEQVVQYTAGVVTDYYGSDDRYDYFKIRGFTPFTYRDGLVIGRTWSGIREEPYALERIEVLKGANSTGFGVSDPGGSVNYVTKRPKSERFGEIYGTGGTFNHKEAGFDFGDNITEDDTLSYRLTGKLQRSDAEYDFSQDDENFIMGGLTWRPTAATSLSFVFDHLDKDGTPSGGGHPRGTDLDRDRFFGEPDYNYDTTNRNTYSVMLDHDFGNGLTFNSNARYSKSDTGFGYAYIYDALGADDPTGMVDRSYFGSDKSSEQFIVDAHLLYETNFADVESRTLLGAEYNKFESKNDSFYTGAPAINWQNPVYSGGPVSLSPYNSVASDQKTKAVYLQQDLTFFDKLTASIGLRNDWLDLKETNQLTGSAATRDFSEFTKRFGLSYKLTEELAAYVSYAESVAPPSAGIEPTVGKQYEAGIKYRPDVFPALFTASIYDLTMENITTYEAPTYLPATVDKIRHRGIDLEAKAEVTDNINLIASYSYIDSNIVENGVTYDGKRFAQVPEHLASVWGTYTIEGNGSRGDMTFGVGARYTGSYYFDNANTRKSDGAIVFDAAFTYKIQQNTTFQLNASNLFDEKHIANDDGGAYYYNPGRAIYATLRQTW